MRITFASLLFVALSLGRPAAHAQDIPHLQHKGDRYSLIVDGKPFLMLGAQINNSSSWPTSLPGVFTALAGLHANTLEAPVYWEQVEPRPGEFDFANVDLLISQAREHHLHLVLLWFGTWKNGADHYVPGWVKSDTSHYPRVISPSGKLLDVLSPHSGETEKADGHAFAALMRHLRLFDGDKHTVVMMQVENETGSFGSVRDFSATAQKLFEQTVPKDLTTALHVHGGTWKQVFGADADESFNAYSIARYVNSVAAAGKAEYPLPMYCNAWIAYPVRGPEGRDRAIPGQAFPSGGPQQANLSIWKAAAPSIDALAPDVYSQDPAFFKQVLVAYGRPDNPLFIPEIGVNAGIGGSFFNALGAGAFGFAPFGVDSARPSTGREAPPPALADDFGLLAPMAAPIAQLNFDGKVRTAVEDKSGERADLKFGEIDAVVSFAPPPPMQGAAAAGPPQLGRMLVAQLGPLEFLIIGIDANVSFRLAQPPATAQSFQLELLQAEEGRYVDGQWKPSRILNGDQTDRTGLNFRGSGQSVVRIQLQRIPLFDPAVASR